MAAVPDTKPPDRPPPQRNEQGAVPLSAAALLLDGVAHKLNNLLGTIVGSADMLADEIAPNSPLREDIHRIRTAGEQARLFMRRITDFSRSHHESQGPQAFTPLVQAALAESRASLPAGVSLRVALADAPLAVRCSTAEIRLLVSFLLDNAVSAMQGTGTIEVSLAPCSAKGVPAPPALPRLTPARTLCLSFRDDGGLDHTALGHVFDPFHPEPPRAATALTLYATYHLVKNLGGDMLAECAGDHGAVFHVFLPLAAPESRLADDRAGARILLVEDDEGMGKVLRRMLLHLGHDVVLEPDGYAALELFHREAGGFDLLMTDYFMPRITGAEVARHIRARKPGLPVLICTGSSAGLPEEALAIDNSAVVYKPVNHAELAEALRQLLVPGTPAGEGTWLQS